MPPPPSTALPPVLLCLELAHTAQCAGGLASSAAPRRGRCGITRLWSSCAKSLLAPASAACRAHSKAASVRASSFASAARNADSNAPRLQPLQPRRTCCAAMLLHAPVACRWSRLGRCSVECNGVNASAALAVAGRAPQTQLGFCRALRRCSLSASAPPRVLHARHGTCAGALICARSSGERAAEVRPSPSVALLHWSHGSVCRRRRRLAKLQSRCG